MEHQPKNEFASRSEVPIQLSLLDLFIWMTAAAIYCVVSQQFLDIAGWLPFFYGRFASELIAFPIGMTALFMLAKAYRQGTRGSLQPGFWLLCVMGVYGVFYVFDCLAIAVEGYIPRGGLGTVFLRYWVFHDLVLEFLTFVSFLAVGILLPVRKVWRLLTLVPLMSLWSSLVVTVWLLTSSGWLWMAFDWIFFGEKVAYGVGVLLIPGLAAWDVVTTDQRRDWLHWLGVIVVFQFFLISLVESILFELK